MIWLITFLKQEKSFTWFTFQSKVLEVFSVLSDHYNQKVIIIASKFIIIKKHFSKFSFIYALTRRNDVDKTSLAHCLHWSRNVYACLFENMKDAYNILYASIITYYYSFCNFLHSYRKDIERSIHNLSCPLYLISLTEKEVVRRSSFSASLSLTSRLFLPIPLNPLLLICMMVIEVTKKLYGFNIANCIFSYYLHSSCSVIQLSRWHPWNIYVMRGEIYLSPWRSCYFFLI